MRWLVRSISDRWIWVWVGSRTRGRAQPPRSVVPRPPAAATASPACDSAPCRSCRPASSPGCRHLSHDPAMPGALAFPSLLRARAEGHAACGLDLLDAAYETTTWALALRPQYW